MLSYLNDRPSAYLDELALMLFDDFGVKLCPSTVWNYLKRKRWSRKLSLRKARDAS